MATTRSAAGADRGASGPDGPLMDGLLKAGRFFTRWDESEDGRAVFREGGRAGDVFYRDRWSHDKVVRSTHGVNCTGSCSWKVYVKDGIITWEAQQTDYPVRRPGPPRVRAARLPARRGLLLVHLLPHPGALPVRPRRAASRCTARPRPGCSDPVLAWADVVGDPERRRRYQQARGKGGLVRVVVGRGGRDRRRRARAHHQDVRPGPVRRLLADPGDVDGLALRRHPLHPADRRGDDVVLRLVRRPACGQPAGLRRPDRRARVRRLVGRDLPDDVGLQRPRHPDAGRALDGRGALPRHQGRHASAPTTPTTPSSPTSGCPPRPAPTPRWRWPWAT